MRKCRVMIIDDERATRKLLKMSIPWEQMNLEVVGEASSGIEAINVIDTLMPDIVFVDIRMPFMDGLEFARLAIQHYPKLRIIILTAYSDFSYARECIGIGVCEYLLKPIVRNEVKEVLERVTKEWENEYTQSDEEKIPVREGSMLQVRRYIDAEFRKPQLNLTMISAQFGFNPSYVSRKFKAEMGIGVIDYLQSKRMEEAEKYAKSKELLYITAKLVGIPDPNYFSKCFKKYTGKSYREYLQQ